MDVVTAEEMRELDRDTIERLGIPAIALMENAGRAIAEEVIALCRRRASVADVAGGGAKWNGTGTAGGGVRRNEAVIPGGGMQSDGTAATHGVAGASSGRRAPGLGADAAGFSVSGDAALTLAAAGEEHWLVLAGKGNNGGDGLAAARHLREAGIAVTLVYAAAPESLAGEAALQRDAAAAMGIPAVVYGRMPWTLPHAAAS